MKNIINKAGLLVLSGMLLSGAKLSAQLGVGPAPYCMPMYSALPCNSPGPSNSAGNGINDFINSFNTTGAVNNIVNNNTGCNAQNLSGTKNYFYFGCPMYLGVNPGQVITCNFQSGITFSQGFALFIDWNQDGVFQVPGERVASTPGVPPAASWNSFNFTVPAAQPNGTYRLRLRCAYATTGSTIDPCMNYGFGETEDYNLVVGPASLGGVITGTASSNAPKCVGQTVSLSVAYSGTTAPTFAWTGPNGFTSALQNPSFSPTSTLSTGIYTVQIIGPCGSTTSTVNVIVNPTPTITALSTPTAICLGNSSNLSASGAATYTWSPGGMTGTPVSVSPAATTIYTATATSSAGCVSTGTTAVTVNPLPTPVANNNSPVCVNALLGLSSTAATSYTWAGPNGFTSNLQNPSIANVSAAASGQYTVTVTSAQGCTATAVTNVTINPLPTVTAAASPTGICVGFSSTLTAGGASSYTWNPGSIASQSTVVSPLVTSNYTVTGTDANGCVNTGTVQVFINFSPNLTVTATPSVICYGQSSTLNCSGGSSYTWQPGNMTTASPVVTPTSTTSYTVFGVSVAGCLSSNTTAVTVNPLPVVSPNSNSPVCTGGTLMLNVSAPGTYSWSGPNGFTSTAQSPNIANATSTLNGVYSVTVTSPAGCVNFNTTNVTVSPIPTITPTNSGPYCVNDQISLNSVLPGIGYSWTGPNGFTSGAQNPTIAGAQVVNGGVYNVTVTTTGGCLNTGSTNVVVNALPTPIANNNSPICVNQTINFTGSGAVSYTWTGPGFNNNFQNPSITSATSANAGVYTFSVTDVNGCKNYTTTTVVVNPLPVIGINSPTACANSSFTLTANGGATYAWTGPLGFNSPQQNPTFPSAAVNMSGNYTVMVTSAQGCTNTAQTTVTVTPVPSPVAINAGPVCSGATLSFSATNVPGATAFAWAGPNGFTSFSQNPTIVGTTTAATGQYSVIVSANSCTNISTTNAVVNPLPTPGITVIPQVCVGQPINFTGSGGGTYSWSGPAGFISSAPAPSIGSAVVNNTGNYILTVTDGNNCVNTTNAMVTVNPLPVVTAFGSTVCANQNANISAAGGVTYSWTGPNGFTSSIPNPVLVNATTAQSGVYNVTVTDVNGCVSSGMTAVVINPIPTPQASNSSPACLNTFFGLNASGGVTYSWSGPNGFFSTVQSPTLNANSVSMTGNYTVTVSDAIGCSSSTVTSVSVIPLPTAAIAASNSKGCAPLCPTFSCQASPGVTQYNWQFGTGEFGTGASVYHCFSTSGDFTVGVTVTDNNNCVGQANFVVNSYSVPVADFNYAPLKPIVNGDGVDFTDASHNGNIVSWNWYFTNTAGANVTSTMQNPHFYYEEPGTYPAVLVVKSENGCTDTIVKAIFVGEDFGIYVPDAFTPNGDGLNDTFQPKGFGITKYEFEIFDRWGERVYATTAVEEGWDGKNKFKGGDVLKTDTYAWRIKLTNTFNKAHEYTGHVTLLK